MTKVWSKRFELIRRFGWLALGALFLALVAALTPAEVRRVTLVFSVLLFLPAFAYTYVVIIWHWKDRYRGNHSDLWGALILVETSGWMKVVYLSATSSQICGIRAGTEKAHNEATDSIDFILRPDYFSRFWPRNRMSSPKTT
jgi:hypothetical protein